MPIDGILLVNKPQGLTSNAILQKVKRLYQAKKAGHTGSLDPLATGMLPVCFGEATKVCQYILDADKSYRATGLLGIKTDTADSQGSIIQTVDNFSIDREQLLAVLKEFTGSIHQIPSMYSALKHQGKPLYRLARQGITIERPAREIVIHAIHLLDFDGLHFEIEVSCSKGTYIRNLVEDIGERLGVYAHVTQLHRISTAGFTADPMYTFDELESMTAALRLDCLLPMERAINYFPILHLDSDESAMLKQGKVILRDSRPEVVGCVRLYSADNEFMGLGEVDGNELKAKRLLATGT